MVAATGSGSLDEQFMPAEREAIRALLIDDDAEDSKIIAALAAKSKQLEVSLTNCRNIEEAGAALARMRFDVLFVDYWLGIETSIPFIQDFARTYDVPCVLLTGLDTLEISADRLPSGRGGLPLQGGAFHPRHRGRHPGRAAAPRITGLSKTEGVAAIERRALAASSNCLYRASPSVGAGATCRNHHRGGQARAFQIWAAYSPTARSLENFPDPATLRMLLATHSSGER